MLPVDEVEVGVHVGPGVGVRGEGGEAESGVEAADDVEEGGAEDDGPGGNGGAEEGLEEEGGREVGLVHSGLGWCFGGLGGELKRRMLPWMKDAGENGTER